ncbi:protein amnionless-like [Orbicella faveolata]|uniref:protein amnionless-like n=1 Tax=Orbicella faveolata TaxID=48498 RepID=UPI0009E40CA4|nr:protein amnionless-like [Orbicella faveolata]
MNRGRNVGLVWLLTCLLLGKQCLAVTKQWLPDTNFNNPANWNKRRVPCDGDNVQLARSNKPLAVSLRRSRTIKSLSLSMNGEVIFYDGAELSFSDTDQDLNACQDPGDLHFLASVQNWYNPYNWQEVALNKQALTQQFAETICSHVTCKKPACSDPFKPEGSCCPLCGSLLKLSLGKDFKMDDYRALLFNVSQNEYEGVTVVTSKTQAGFVQIVLTDQENGI